jgi:hypothetical protein
MEGKWFAEQPHHAAEWGTRFYGEGPFHILETRVPMHSSCTSIRISTRSAQRATSKTSMRLDRAHFGIREYTP